MIRNLYRIITILAVGSLILVMTPAVASAHNVSDSSSPKSLFEMIMNRFHSNEDSDVNSFIGMGMTRWHMNYEDKKNRIEDRLNRAVAKGVITEEEKDKIMRKMNEFHDEMQKLDFASMSREDRINMIKEHKDEMRKWAEENGINYDDVLYWCGFNNENYMRNKNYRNSNERRRNRDGRRAFNDREFEKHMRQMHRMHMFDE